ncbi:MAG: radical SAM/SPASM domain-containing protein [Ignavibacteriaceae bacterium]
MTEINLFRYLTAGRLLNAAGIYFSYGLSVILRKPIVFGSPVSISIEPTTTCNLKCPECPTGTGSLLRPKGTMDLQLFKKIIDRVYKRTFYLQLFFQGEPFINNKIYEMIEYAKSKRMYVSISTNGTLFSENNINKLFASPPDKLIYSFDGTDEESYNKYRVGGDFNEVKKGLESIVAEKKKRKLNLPYIELQMIVMKHNEGSINDFIEFGKAAGVNKITLKSMQIYNQEEADNLLPENPEYRRYIKINGEYKLKQKLNNRCFALWRSAVVTWDGYLAACCFDKDAEFSTKKLTERDFISLFKSDVLQGLRGQILKNRKAVDICRNCSEGMKVNIREISF